MSSNKLCLKSYQFYDSAYPSKPYYESNFNIVPLLQLNNDSSLPPYSCTVKKQGIIYIKNEINNRGFQLKNCKWKKAKLSVFGTLVYLEYLENKSLGTIIKELVLFDRELPPPYILTWPINEAHIEPAENYFNTFPYTFRVCFHSGEQFLIRSESYIEAKQWVSTLLASIDIASDIDLRNEPNLTPRRIIFHPNNQVVQNRTIQTIPLTTHF